MPTFDWFNAAGWPELGYVPTSTATTIIPSGRIITLGGTGAAIAKLTVQNGGTLQLNAGSGLDVYTNLIVDGTLSAPVSGGGNPVTVTFHATTPSFVGGGTVPLDTDTGLWVTGNGALNVAGVTRRGWSTATAGLVVGATTFTCADALTGWATGDEVVISPTEDPSVTGYVTHDEIRTITNIAGSTVTVASLTYAHPAVSLPNGTTRYAEVANLTRNVTFQGDSVNQSHVWIRSALPQTLTYGVSRWMGVFNITDRSGLGFEHGDDIAAAGGVVTGWVCRSCRNYGFVPHVTSGITFTQCVAYDTQNKAYHWFEGDQSNNIVWDTCLAIKVFMPPNQGGRLSAFTLGTGNGNIIRNCVACGVQGNKSAAGIEWAEHAGDPNVWDSHDVVSHNHTHDGVFDWQNDSNAHYVDNFTIYHCDVGIEHGAYVNLYEFDGIVTKNCPGGAMQMLANSRTTGTGRVLRVHDSTYDGASVTQDGIAFLSHTLPGANPTELTNLTFKNFTRAAVSVVDDPTAQPTVAKLTNPVLNGVNALWFATTCHPSSQITISGSDPGIPVGGPWIVHPTSWPTGTPYAPWNAKLVSVNVGTYQGSLLRSPMVTVQTW